MLRWLDFKNIFIWFGFSQFLAMLSFFLFFFYYETEFFWKEHALAMWHCMFPMHVLIEVSRILEGTSAHHVEWSLKFGLSRRDLPLKRKKKQTKKKSKGKSSHWLLGKNSKRHNFIGSKWNHALQKVICSFKYKYNLWGRAFDSSLYPEFLDG